MGESAGPGSPRRVRVGLVDDLEKIRLLLRLTFDGDDRFEVVGEAANGLEAIDLVKRTRPDLLILDRQMPVLGGVEALPQILREAPRTAVVVYTGGADSGTYQAALAAGALDILDKAALGSSFIDDLARILVDHWAQPDADVEVRVGPVPSAAARVWIHNTAGIIGALRAEPDVLDNPVPSDVLDLFDRLLESWRGLALDTEEFYWMARASVADVERLVEHWAVIDRMSDGQLQALGRHWSPPEGRPFFHALTVGVLDALAARAETQELAKVLARQWREAGGPYG